MSCVTATEPRWCHCFCYSAWLKRTSPALETEDSSATGEQTIFKCVLDGRSREEEEKKCQQSLAAAEGSWGTARPITLLCKGSCCIIENAEFPVISTWVLLRCDLPCSEPRIIKAKEAASKKNGELIKSQERGSLGSELQDRSRVFTHRGTKQLRCRNKRGGTHPTTITLLRYGLRHMREGDGVWGKAGEEGSGKY